MQHNRRSTSIAQQFKQSPNTAVKVLLFSSCCPREFQLRPPGPPALAAGHVRYNMWVLQLRPLGALAAAAGRLGCTRWAHPLRPFGGCGGWPDLLQMSVNPAEAFGRYGLHSRELQLLRLRAPPAAAALLVSGNANEWLKRRYMIPTRRINRFSNAGVSTSFQHGICHWPASAGAPAGRSWIDRQLQPVRQTTAAAQRPQLMNPTGAAKTPNGRSGSAQRPQL